MRRNLEKYRDLLRQQLLAIFEGPAKLLDAALGPYWSSARSWYRGREQREKVLLKALGALIAVLLAYNLIYQPLVGLSGDLRNNVQTRQHQLVQVRAMMRRWEHLKTQLASTEKRTVSGGKDFSLFSVIEKTLTKSVGRDKIGSITPSDKPVAGGFIRHAVDLKLNDVSLGQIVNALYGVQTLDVPVTVSDLRIHQRSGDPHSYDVDMICAALGRNG
ncbi:MAG: type II secretion system protein GspM [Candidatus Binataceae bacterium]